ncbi:hypothetical protein [Sphingomonas guangdongensis]|uniref:hypothetical protein n=1 Tax=Sphingomonas guangdongensis TaxID=1141890 RepID=UPI000BE354DE|nr:hypothetical protein [Sphingomonas guangdongensis]
MLPALLLAAAIAIRAIDFGNPVIHVDEQYYLLVGQRMLDGAVPYLDLWDRKPWGLFALYAAAAAIPGDDILGYQLLATLFAAATAWIVASGARTLGASRGGALAAGVAYLLWLSLLGGRGGQAPVFYNLLIALAARLTLRLPSLSPRAIVANGLAACLLGGLAIQLKPVAAVEAAFLGAAHLWYLARTSDRRRAIAAAPLWIAVGLLPTLAVMAGYRALGADALGAWWFANVTSILLRPGYPPGELAMRLLGIAAELSPLLLCAAIGWRRRNVRMVRERQLAFGWLAAALVGFFSIGTFFDHYALPLLVPLATIAGIALGRIPRVMVGTLVLGALLAIVERAVVPADAAGARAVAAVVRANSAGGCPYVFIGDTITYSLADACVPTPYAFPNFIAYTTEQASTGIDEAAELRRILAGRPPVIVASTRSLRIWNPATLPVIRQALARDYRPIFSVPRSGWRTVVFLRRDRALSRSAPRS